MLLAKRGGMVGLLVLLGCSAHVEGEDAATLRKTMQSLRPLHEKLGKPGPGDWLANHKEPGQTFAQYLRSSPVLPRGRRKVLYIQPLGEFSAKQQKIVELTADFLGRYYSLEVQTLKRLPPTVIPQAARRKHPSWGMEQIFSPYVLDKVLAPRLPDDAAAMLALTATDLYPADDWNFVFGQASLKKRVGVWSLYRNGDPEQNEESYRLCLLRTLKTAAHETGHMFSMKHCILYECNMCGSNHREESDRRPILLCPECLAKVCWATRADPLQRYQKLAAFCKEQGLQGEYERYVKAIEALEE